MSCEAQFRIFCDSESHACRTEALNSLISLDCRALAHRLLERLALEDEYTQVSIIFSMRNIANVSMRNIANERARAILATMMYDQSLSGPVRGALTEVVGDLGMIECLPILRCQLYDASAPIRFWSCESLGMLGDRDDLAHLQAMLTDNDLGYLDRSVADAARRAMRFISSRSEE